ncbi:MULTISPECIES: ABC-2 transporter permease [unclassified Clostridium]|uniref:ABC-2 transporter permease n=1 Tax=unclassified Clostridium TaxID=2614128 RepID=UPI0025C312CA|nr:MULTISPECIES: ABC-2 transporter permease [unclassified Clostridium]
MWNLVIKDFVVQKTNIKFILIYALAGSLFFATLGDGAYIMIPMMLSYTYLLGGLGQDDKNNSEFLLNSLPVSRDSIVYAKYLSVIIFSAIAIVLTMGGIFIMSSIGLSKMTGNMRVENIVGFLFGIMIFMAINFPLYFKYGYAKLRYFNFGIFILFLISPIIIKFLKDNINFNSPFMLSMRTKLLSLSDTQIGIFIICMALFIYLLSLVISLNIYKKKEF